MKALVIELTKKLFYLALCILFTMLAMIYAAFGIVINITGQSSFLFLFFFLFGGVIMVYLGCFILVSIEMWLFPEHNEAFD